MEGGDGITLVEVTMDLISVDQLCSGGGDDEVDAGCYCCDGIVIMRRYDCLFSKRYGDKRKQGKEGRVRECKLHGARLIDYELMLMMSNEHRTYSRNPNSEIAHLPSAETASSPISRMITFCLGR